MYCHGCYASFDQGDHKLAGVYSTNMSREILNMCEQCKNKGDNGGPPVGNSDGPKIGSQRVPMDQKYPLYVITHYSKNVGSPPAAKE